MKKLKKGQKINIKAGNRSGVPAGPATVTIVYTNYYQVVTATGTAWNIYAGDFTLQATTKKELLQEAEELAKQVQDVQSKINWMEDAGVDTYNESEHKVWKALTALESKKTKVEKMKILAELIQE